MEKHTFQTEEGNVEGKVNAGLQSRQTMTLFKT